MPSGIISRLGQIRSLIPAGVELVAVSKFKPIEDLKEAYEGGQRLFGESRVQELLSKIPLMPEDVKWHFIGHLQTNKVRQIVGKAALIESVDSERLLEVIDREGARLGLQTDVLLQVHVAREETKFGFLPDEIKGFFAEGGFRRYPYVRIRGIMAMASNTEDTARVRKDFAEAAAIFGEIKRSLSEGSENFNVLSMGMSGDWPLAVEEGSTLVRIGSAIFGER